MANNNNPDLLYFKSRDDLLQYEDAKFNSLIQALANFYTTRNDQSIWGNFIRALAQELGRTDYGYNYDIVGKNPSFLTPADIRRRWADPLYVSSNWPSPQQGDFAYKEMLVELLAAYREGTTVDAIQKVIFAYTGINITVVELYKEIGNGIYDQSDRNSLSVSIQVGNAGSNPLTTVTSLAQLQTIVQSLYNAIALAKPAHVGLEFTTVFGEGEDLDCILSPQTLTEQQFGEAPATQQALYQQTGYTQVNPALFWKASTAFPIGNLLRDSNANFQIVTSVGTFPNESGLTAPSWNLLSGGITPDNELTWTNISPAVTSTAVASNIITVDLSFAVPLNVGTIVKLYNMTSVPALDGVALTVITTSDTSFTASFTHANYATTAETTGTATFPLPATITTVQYGLLNATWKALYQKLYTNFCCVPCNDTPVGMTDTLRIFVQQTETGPLGPMLIQAPVLDPTNPKTTIAAYGRLLQPTLTPAQWAALPSIFVNIINAYADGTNATYSYVPTTQFLHEGEVVAITGFTNAALNVTSAIKNVYNSVANILKTSITSNVLTVTAPNLFVPGMLVTIQGTAESFLNGQSLIIQSATPTTFTADFTHANYTNNSDSGTAEVSTFQIPSSAVVSLEAPSPSNDAGLVTPTLQSAYYLNNGSYVLGNPPINLSGAGIGSSWTPGGTVFQGQIIVDSNGNTQVALNAGVSGSSAPSWNTATQGNTPDNTVNWRNLGRDTFSVPTTWVQILNMETDAPTGEVGNWDALHQYGLVAPRLNQVWEIGGNPQDQDFIFGLY